MALFSLNHRPIGKSTQPRAYGAAAHVRYISRKGALTHWDSERVPSTPQGVMQWLKHEENHDRKNARVVDKVMVALPKELTPQQRHVLVRAFAEEITDGKASWLAAFHDKGKDADNPHCHIVIRDRDPETGKRAVGMSEQGSTQRLRDVWERLCNAHLRLHGHDIRIDKRTLKAQGVARAPTVHEGPKARKMAAQGRELASRKVWVKNGSRAKGEGRWIDFTTVDGGVTRMAYNENIRRRKGGAMEPATMSGDAYRSNFKARQYEGVDPVVHGMLSTPDDRQRFENAKEVYAVSMHAMEQDKAHHHLELIADEQLNDRLGKNQKNLDAAAFILSQNPAGRDAMLDVRMEVNRRNVLGRARKEVPGSVKAKLQERQELQEATQNRIDELEQDRSFFGKKARAEELEKLRYQLAAEKELVNEVAPFDGERFKAVEEEQVPEIFHVSVSRTTRVNSLEEPAVQQSHDQLNRDLDRAVTDLAAERAKIKKSAEQQAAKEAEQERLEKQRAFMVKKQAELVRRPKPQRDLSKEKDRGSDRGMGR